MNIKTEKLEDLRDKSTGTLKLDFSINEHRQAFFERFGGEEYIKEKYPAVYKAVVKPVAISSKSSSLPKDEGKDEDYILSPPGITTRRSEKTVSDSSEYEYAQYMVGQAGAFFAEKREYCVTWGVLVDNIGNKLDSFYNEYYDVTDVPDELSKYFPDLQTADNREYHTEGECIAVKKNGEVEIYTGKKSTTMTVEGGASIVKSFTITAPVHTNEKESEKIIVLYNREPFSSEEKSWDYKEPDNKPEDNKVKTLLLFSGEIKLKDNYEILEYMQDTGNYTELVYNGEEKPVVSYGYNDKYVAKHFKIAADKKSCTFEFHKDWNCPLDLSRYTANTVNLDLMVAFRLGIRNKILGKNRPVDFIVSSSTDKNNPYFTVEGTTVYVPKISIRWGCFHRATLIRMADGSDKRIDEIKIGDKVQIAGGGSKPVTNILTGTEKKLVRIVTIDEKDILLTAGHPITTNYGIIKADNVRPGDILPMSDGKEVEVKFAHECEYDDMVYNLVLDSESNTLIANGFLAGDYEAQNNVPEQKEEKEPLSPEVEELVSQMKILMREAGIVKV